MSVLVEHADHVGQQQQARRAARRGDRSGDGIGVDVVGLALRSDADRRDERNNIGMLQRGEDLRVDHGGLDDEATVEHLLDVGRSEEHTSELQSLMRISYAVFCLKKNNNNMRYTKLCLLLAKDNTH